MPTGYPAGRADAGPPRRRTTRTDGPSGERWDAGQSADARPTPSSLGLVTPVTRRNARLGLVAVPRARAPVRSGSGAASMVFACRTPRAGSPLKTHPARTADPPPPSDTPSEHAPPRRARDAPRTIASARRAREPRRRTARGCVPGGGLREARRRGAHASRIAGARRAKSAAAATGRGPPRGHVGRVVARLERAPRLEPRGPRSTHGAPRKASRGRSRATRARDVVLRAGDAGVEGAIEPRRGRPLGDARPQRSQRREVERTNGRVERANKREIAPVPVRAPPRRRSRPGRDLVERRRARLERQRPESRRPRAPKPANRAERRREEPKSSPRRPRPPRVVVRHRRAGRRWRLLPARAARVETGAQRARDAAASAASSTPHA